MITLAYYCMPQVFFYGVYVLAGQVLNARDKFGPMMWAPIANNLVSIVGAAAVLGGLRPDQHRGALHLRPGAAAGRWAPRWASRSRRRCWSPSSGPAGYRYRPRFDFRHTGLARRSGWPSGRSASSWSPRLALVVVNRAGHRRHGRRRGRRAAAYANAYAVWILPHSLITVSLATAMLPSASRLAAAGDLAGVADETTRTIRLAVTALLPAAVAFFVLGLPIAQLLFGFGQGAEDAPFVGCALMALAVGLVPFTVQYVCLRAFYALEDNRTTFFLQCLIAGTNVALGVAGRRAARPAGPGRDRPGRRVLGGLRDRRRGLLPPCCAASCPT